MWGACMLGRWVYVMWGPCISSMGVQCDMGATWGPCIVFNVGMQCNVVCIHTT